MKKILLAIPTAKYIEVETFKSIYDLEIPPDTEVKFQYFYGYNIDQVRNLIASPSWGSNPYFDYLFAVDSDIVLPNDCLTKMLAHDVDMVSGVYIQRIPDTENIEVYRNKNGGMLRISLEEILPPGLHPVDGCGFGCVLVKSDVLRKIGYPQFKYHSALDHKDTISEDTDFCAKAAKVGAKIFVDSSIVCNHIGSTTYRPADRIALPVTELEETPTRKKMREIATWDLMPETHKGYLGFMKEGLQIEPKVIYDIGANCLHWTKAASKVWPDAQYVAFEATDSLEFLYWEAGMKYHIGVLSDKSGKEVDFFQNDDAPSGNSYYRENVEFSPDAKILYPDEMAVKRKTITLDAAVKKSKLPEPDMIKMDIQGAELDVLKGAKNTLKNCTDLILELQHKEYNIGSPHKDVVIEYLDSIGFKLITSAENFDMNEVAGDYHFTRK